MLLSGHASIGDLAQAYNILPHPDNSTVTNGHMKNGDFNTQTKSYTESTHSFHSALHILLDRGFLSSVHESYFRPDADNRSEAEALVRRLKDFHGELKGDQKHELAEAIEKRLLDWKMGTDGSSEAFTVSAFEKPVKNRKRKWEAEPGLSNDTRKRHRPDTQLTETVGASPYDEEDFPTHQGVSRPMCPFRYY